MRKERASNLNEAVVRRRLVREYKTRLTNRDMISRLIPVNAPDARLLGVPAMAEKVRNWTRGR